MFSLYAHQVGHPAADRAKWANPFAPVGGKLDELASRTKAIETLNSPLPVTNGGTALTAIVNNRALRNKAAGSLIAAECYKVRKSADESVTNSTAVQDDDELQHPLTANLAYEGDLYLHVTVSASATAGFRFTFTFPAGAVLSAGYYAFDSGVVLQGALLAFFQSAILAALAVSFSAFLPVPLSVASVTLVYILGNISSYMLASVENLGGGALPAAGRALSNVMPNLGYFNLQTHFSEGKIISSRYLALSFVYASLHVGAVFLVSCSLFRRREVC